jgi:hypothetical protein
LSITITRAVYAEPSAAAATTSLVVPLFAGALFTGAFLLFMVEPMVAKMVLPILGGAPMVWNACVVFFQAMLLAGYGYAYAAARWMDVPRHTIVHSVLLLIPFAFLPLLIDGGTAAPKAGNPILWLLLLLTVTVGLPFFVLSTTASVLQHWFSRSGDRGAKDPYFLYASSNLGSLMALAAYPTLVEPTLSLRHQSRLWAAGYAVFVVLTAACAVVAWRRERATGGRLPVAVHADEDPIAACPLPAWRRLQWIALAFIPSSLMLAITSYLSTDIAAMPLLWVVPLGLYLLTFVIAFSARSGRARSVSHRALPLLIVPLGLVLMAHIRGPLSLVIPIHLLTFTVAALVCHAELAHQRPAATHLTEFYFWISFGGMLGGLFNTLAAPLLFGSIVEYPLVLVAACLFLPGDRSGPWMRKIAYAVAAAGAIGALTAAVLLWYQSQRASAPIVVGALTVLAVAVFTQRRHPLRFTAALAALLVAGSMFQQGGEQVVYAERTFFGVYRVSLDASRGMYSLWNGTTLHGVQAHDPVRRHEPLAYYHRTGPFGQMMAAAPPGRGARVAVVGLGVGTLAAYAQPGQRWTFYEIDPAAERIARTSSHFTYLEDCGSGCDVVLGDARVSLAAAPMAVYDLIVLDAFSSDSIPVHLMTREALSIYLARLAPQGRIAFHISSRHLALSPVLAGLSGSLHLTGIENLDRSTGANPEGKMDSHWVVLARRADDLGALGTDSRWRPLVAPASARIWTDDFSNILSVIRFR